MEFIPLLQIVQTKPNFQMNDLRQTRIQVKTGIKTLKSNIVSAITTIPEEIVKVYPYMIWTKQISIVIPKWLNKMQT